MLLMMRCKLTSIGNEMALMLDPEMLAQLGVSANDELEITSDGQRLVIYRASADGFEKAVSYVFDKYGTTLSRLTD
jgi:antitoxin component of MazEF toxin-antitoxin module